MNDEELAYITGYWRVHDEVLGLFISTDIEDLDTIRQYKSKMYQIIVELRPKK